MPGEYKVMYKPIEGSPYHSFRMSGPVAGGNLCDLICVLNELDLYPIWVPSLSFPTCRFFDYAPHYRDPHISAPQIICLPTWHALSLSLSLNLALALTVSPTVMLTVELARTPMAMV